MEAAAQVEITKTESLRKKKRADRAEARESAAKESQERAQDLLDRANLKSPRAAEILSRLDSMGLSSAEKEGNDGIEWAW